MIDEERSVAVAVLKRLRIEPRDVRMEIERLVYASPKLTSKPPYPFTPRAKLAGRYANVEAHALGHDYVGTGHQLLGLLRVSEGVAAEVLLNFGVPWEALRNALLDVLASEPGLDDAQGGPGSSISPDVG